MVTMLNMQQKLYQKQYALSFGSLFAAIVALIWIGLLATYTKGELGLFIVVALLLLGLFALVAGIYVRLKYPIKIKVALPYLHSWSFWLKFYGAILAEFIIIFVLIRLFDSRQMQVATIPLIVFVVGLHFLPLAYWNGNRLWYITSSLLCVGILALVTICPAHAITHALGAYVAVWELVSVGLMTTVMLFTSLLSSVMYKRLIA